MSNAPKPPEAPKVEPSEDPETRRLIQANDKPTAPAPEPKQESGVSWTRCVNCGDALGSNWNCSVCGREIRKQHDALRAEVERLRRRLEVLESGHGRSVNSDPQP